jgi:transposase
MKPYSIDFREKVVKAYEQGDTSIRKVAARFDVSKAFVQKLLKQKQTTGDVRPRKQGGSLKSVLHGATTQLAEMVEKYPDSTLSEYCEYWQESHKQWVSPSMMCRELKKQHLTRKKRRYGVVSAPRNECKISGVSIGRR